MKYSSFGKLAVIEKSKSLSTSMLKTQLNIFWHPDKSISGCSQNRFKRESLENWFQEDAISFQKQYLKSASLGLRGNLGWKIAMANIISNKVNDYL